MFWKKRIVSAGLLTALSLSVLFGQDNLLVNGDFEKGLDGWTLRGPWKICMETSASGKNSGMIQVEKAQWNRLFQEIRLDPSAEYELEYYVKCRDVILQPGAKFGGASVGVMGLKRQTLYGSGGAWKLDAGTCDWKKVKISFNSKDLGDGLVNIQIQLTNASGTAWIDNLVLRKISPGVQGQPYTLEIYPLQFLKNEPFAVAENLVGTLVLKTVSKKKYGNGSAEMNLEVPVWLKVTGACRNLALPGADGKRVHVSDAVEETGRIVRNGVPYRRFKITFADSFLKFFGTSWYSHLIFLEAEKGSAGRQGEIHWTLNAAGDVSPEGKGYVEVIPPILPGPSPARRFQLMVCLPATEKSTDSRLGKVMSDFWNGVAERSYRLLLGGDRWNPVYRNTFLFGSDLSAAMPGSQKALEKLRKKMPFEVDDKGNRKPFGCSWYKVDDPEKLFEKFFRETLREIRKEYPDVKIFVWDFEPHPYGFDEGGRARFARVMGLAETPSIEKINSVYPEEWFNYMVKLHGECIGKVAKILHSELPDAEFWLCSDNLHAGGQPVAGWCGVDVRLSDQDVETHLHMPYYTGTRYFDDVAFNVNSLKKPFFPLIDPAENLWSFYKQYTPDKVRQNILATIALGGVGIGFWPEDAFTAHYYRTIADAFAAIAAGEDFYFDGKRADSEFTVTPRNAVEKTVTAQDGRKTVLYFPDFKRTLRYTAHHLKNDYLFTVFNYHEKEGTLVEVSGHGKKILAWIPANGVETFRLSSPQDQTKLQKQLAELSAKRDSGALRELRKDRSSIEWEADSEGSPVLRMSNGTVSAAIDLMGDGSLVSLRNKEKNELLQNGFAGKLLFYDTLQQPVIYVLKEMESNDNIPCVTLQGIVPPYEGANPSPNPLLGMEITRKYELKNQEATVSILFRNPTGKEMSFGFRINNFPMPGSRFDKKNYETLVLSGGEWIKAGRTRELFLCPGVKIPFLQNRTPLPWEKSSVIVSARDGHLSDRITFLPLSTFAGIFCCDCSGVLPAQTVEFLSPEIRLPPGGSAEFKYRISTLEEVSKR